MNNDQRALCALRFLDAADGTPAEGPLWIGAREDVTESVKAPPGPLWRRLSMRPSGSRFVRNRSGVHVLLEAPGWQGYCGAFDLEEAEDLPAVGSKRLDLAVVDLSGRFLPRLFSVDLPRDPDPAHRDTPGSLFQPIDVLLYSSPVGRPATGCAVLRLRVTKKGSTEGLPWTRVHVVRDDPGRKVLARGLCDDRGEALIPVPGIPVTSWNGDAGDGKVIVTETAVEIVARFKAVASLFPNPDDLDDDFDSSVPPDEDPKEKLASGRELLKKIEIQIQ